MTVNGLGSYNSQFNVNLNFEAMRRRSPISLDEIGAGSIRNNQTQIAETDDKQRENDMIKAVSQMEKDSSLQQYQYFVGESNVILDNEDGRVIIK